MRAFITGGSGFVGRRLVGRLAGEGALCTVLSRREPPTRDERVVTVRGDCADAAVVRDAVAAARPDVVFHCAMTSGHPASHAERVEMLGTAVIGTANVLDASLTAGVRRFVHACSGLIYGPQPRALVEDDPLAPTTVRGVAKAGAALLVRQYGTTTALHTVSLRIFSVYGPGESPSRFIPTVLRCARTGAPLPLIPWPRHDFVYVDDVVESLLLAATADVASGRAFNVAGGRTWTNAEVVEAAASATGRQIRIADAPHRSSPADAVVWQGDIAAAGRDLGWAPRVDLHAGLRRFFAHGEPACPT